MEIANAAFYRGGAGIEPAIKAKGRVAQIRFERTADSETFPSTFSSVDLGNIHADGYSCQIFQSPLLYKVSLANYSVTVIVRVS